MKKIQSLEEYQSYLRAMLFFFDELCRENDIKYTVMDGTLLGTVRNHGLIPWDGDVDVAVTHKEFEKLKKAFENYNGRFYFNYFPDHYFKKYGVKKSYGTITAKVVDTKCDNEIFGIDVFTIDFLGDDKEFAEETVRLYKKWSKRQCAAIAFHLPKMSKNKSLVRNALNAGLRFVYPFAKFASIIYTPIFKKGYQNFLDERLSFDETCKYFSIEPYLGRIGVEENTILNDGYVDMMFDNIKVMVVKNYEAYLVPTYGDYMQLPPEDKRTPYPSLEELMDCNIEIDEEMRKYIEYSIR